MNSKTLLSLITLICISFSAKGNEISEDKPSLRGKHTLALSLINPNYTPTKLLDSDISNPEFFNYANSLSYSYGIGRKTNFRTSLSFFYNYYEGKLNNDEDFFIKYQALESRTGIEKFFGDRKLRGFYGIDLRVQYAKVNSNYYCMECYPNYIRMVYAPYRLRQVDIGLVPFFGIKYIAQSGLVVSTEIALSFNLHLTKEYHTGNTFDLSIMPYSTRLLNVGYMF